MSGVLNGLERFTAASASYVLFNVISIACMIWMTPYVPTVGHALSWGVTIAGVVQLGLLLVALRRAGMALSVPRPRMTPQMRLLMRRMAPGLVGAGVTQLNLAVDVIIASLLPAGTVSVLYFADRVQQLPLGVIGTAVGTALLPLLSRQVRAAEAQAAIGTLNRAMEYALFLTLPAALALIICGYPIILVLFGRGAFSAQSVLFSSQCLAAYAVGLPAFVLVKVLAPAFFARGDTAMPVKIGTACVALNLCLNLAFMIPLAHMGPALATSVAAIANCIGLAFVLHRRRQWQPDYLLKRRVSGMVAASVAMGLVLYAVRSVLFSIPMHGVIRFAALGALIAIGMLVYAAAAQLFGAYDLRQVTRMMSRRRLRAPEGSAISAAPTVEVLSLMQRVFSGIQPSGIPTLGNYLGAIRNWAALQADHECIYCVVDLHAITAWQDPAALRQQTLEMAAVLLACGIDPENHILFLQSAVRSHVQLAWIFNCVARIGWLNRMTQFKDKAGKDRENASAGLYVYPNLMAADIHAYHATRVPVGEDQRQHLELANDIAQKFNHDYGVEFFPNIEPMILGPAARVMSLRDGTKKMSKSDPSDQSRINLNDDPDTIALKIRRAKTDPLPLPDTMDGLNTRPEARNLVGIYAALSETDHAAVLKDFGGKGFGPFKEALAGLMVEKLSPIAAETKRWLDDPGLIIRSLRTGAERAAAIADPIVAEAERLVGFMGRGG